MNPVEGLAHKKWRKIAKKFRRKRVRQKRAKERDLQLNKEHTQLLLNPAYQSWLHDQEAIEAQQAEFEQCEHDRQEEMWLRRELLAQKQFHEEKRRRAATEEAKEKERLRIQKEFEEQQKLVQQRIAEKKRLAEERRLRQEVLLQKINIFVNAGGELPAELYESADTNPGKEGCLFFLKTAACRFGVKCNRNHSRPGISRLLLISHFFTNIRLEQPAASEYGSDLALEFSEAELYRSYDDFFRDVTSELRKYGEIVNFRTCKNSEPHLRGNVYVEFQDERSAMRAYQQLQGRFYAGKQINVEFCKLMSWKAAICGLSLSRKCPKGANCNYLHVFRNPESKYSSKEDLAAQFRSPNDPNSKEESKQTTSWNEDNAPSQRNWRWSESPERDSCNEKERRSRRYSRSTDRKQRNNSNNRMSSNHNHSSSSTSKRNRRSNSKSRDSSRSKRSRSRSSRRSNSKSRDSSRSKRSRSRSSQRSNSKSRDSSRSKRSRSRSSRRRSSSKSAKRLDARKDFEKDSSKKRSRSKSKGKKKRKRRKRSNSIKKVNKNK